MLINTHRARVTRAWRCIGGDGRRQRIPVGPCLVQIQDTLVIEIIWGAQGQRSASLADETVAVARHSGLLVLLD